MTIRNKRIIVIVCCIGALVVGVMAMIAQPPGSSLSVLPWTTIFRNQPTAAERLIPRRWTWAWRLHDRFFGKPKSLKIYIRDFGFSNSPQFLAAQFHLGHPAAETNGLKIWLVSSENLPPLKKYADTHPGGGFIAAPNGGMAYFSAHPRPSFIDIPSEGVAIGQVGQNWTVTYAERMDGRLMDLQAALHLYTIGQAQGETFTTLHAKLTRESGILVLTNGFWSKGAGVIIAGLAVDAKGNKVFY